MKILVETVSGKSVTVEVESAETIKRIKVEMQDEKQQMEDGNTQPVLFEIFVKNPNGKAVPVEVESSETILNLKRKLADSEIVPPHEFNLIFNAKLLEDQKTLADCGIKKGDVIHMMLILRRGSN